MSPGGPRLLGGAAGLMVRELQLCGVSPAETVIVYSDEDGRADLFENFSTAAQLLGATVLELRVPRKTKAADADAPVNWWTTTTDAVRTALTLADLVVDVSGGGLFHAGQQTILSSGTRILRAREPMRRLEALFPDPRVVAHATHSGERLAASLEMHFSSPSGTDLRVPTGKRPVTIQYGYTDTPGRWDHMGTALAALAPAEGAGDGVYVLAPGDVVFFTATVGRYLTEPLRVEFREGSITSITGGIEAAMLEDLIDAAPSDHARRLSHVGWGCDPRAEWNGVELYGRDGGGGADVRSVYGTVVVAFGANLDLGGTSDSPVHVDLATRIGSVTVDGATLLDSGRFTVPELTID